MIICELYDNIDIERLTVILTSYLLDLILPIYFASNLHSYFGYAFLLDSIRATI